MRLSSSALVLVLLALAGCGGSGGEFTDDYNQAITPLRELEQGMGTKPREYERLARRMRATRAKLARLDPPDDARTEFRALLTEFDRRATDLSSYAAAARSNDVAAQRQAAEALAKSDTGAQRAESRLKKAVDG